MASLPCESSAVVAGGGMLSQRSRLQLCVLNTRTADEREIMTCIQDGGGLYSTYRFSQLCCFCLLMRQSTQFCYAGEKSWSDCLNRV